MIIKAKDFDLNDTVFSGQLFRAVRTEDGTAIFQRDKAFFARQDKDRLFVDGVSRKFATRFFGLDHELTPIIKNISKDKHMRTAIKAHKGLRIMRQDPWECTVNFICSSCASIPKITKNLNQLAQAFGESIEIHGIKGHTFPEPGAMNSLSKIQKAGTGYRSKYLQALNSVTIKDLEVSELRYDLAKEKLMSNDGIGPKVADCILLFAHGFHQAFPVDTWIQKGIQNLYFDGVRQTPKNIRLFADEYFGKYAGYAQQYIFQWYRTIRN